jgi:pyruvate dehydrogenase E2 component (dihydrolipoamide acetyltransferase)
MATEFRLPELGENIEKGDLLKVLVAVGDRVNQEQPILELETDKATIEVPSSVAGQVKEIHVKAGQKIKVGQLIMTVEDGAGVPAAGPVEERKAEIKGNADARAGADAAKAVTEAAIEDKRGEEPGQAAHRQEAAEAGAAELEKQRRPSPKPIEAKRPEPAPEKPAVAAEAEGPRPIIPAAPSVRRHARELGFDIGEVPGTGPAGRISSGDVTTYAREVISGSRGRAGVSLRLPDFTKWGPIERKPMSAIRRKTAERMAQAWSSVAAVTQYGKADITSLEELRKRYDKKASTAGGKLTLTAIALKVAVAALKVFPQFAASIDLQNEEIVYKRYFHIGVAVDTDRGLLVPVIRDVDQKNIIQLAVELQQMAEKSRAKKLTLEEMEGGVFTITNLGGIGGTGFSPIVNAPEVAILGISRAALEPVYRGSELVPRLMLPLSLSYDHRLIDGADAARFLQWIVEALEQPFLLALEG